MSKLSNLGKYKNSLLLKEYKNEALPIADILFPFADINILEDAIEYSIMKRFKDTDIVLDNSYKKKKTNSTLLNIAEYILRENPIISSYGTLYKSFEDTDFNLIKHMMELFMSSRKILKKEMFKYQKGSELFNKYDLLQLLAKIDANSLYGAIGMCKSIFYNLYVAGSITSQAVSANTTAATAFEAFLANNVKFRSLDEMITFINNTLSEINNRNYIDYNWLDSDIDIELVFEKLIMTCGHGYIPTMNHMQIIWDILNRLSQTDLNRLFYKNNLFAFIENSRVFRFIESMLIKLNGPFLDPNVCPKEIEIEMNIFIDLISEYVLYNHGYNNVVERIRFLPRKVSAALDTDSTMLHLDPFYRYILDKTINVDMNIKRIEMIPVNKIEFDEYGDLESMYIPIQRAPIKLDYSFFDDKVIELGRFENPINIIPQDGFRYSCINIIAYTLTQIIKKVFIRYTKNTNTYREDKDCLLIMKNEFLFKSMMLTDAKKHYATIQELQEGKFVNNYLDVKGIEIISATLDDYSRDVFKSILEEEVLNVDNINQINILKRLIIFEKEIISSLEKGEKKYYKSVRIKSQYAYDNPMIIQGIKGALLWNVIKNDYDSAINLDERNSLDLLIINLNIKDIEKLKEYLSESKYKELIDLTKSADQFKNGFNILAVPKDSTIPDWLKEFIDYDKIVNKIFAYFSPVLQSVGLTISNKNNKYKYSNIVKI